MPVVRLRTCIQCGKHIHPDSTCTCGATHGEARRKARHQAHGYGTKAWATLKQKALENHPWCASCRSEHDLTVDHLTYPARTINDVRVLCRRCNSKDARGTL